MSAGHSTATIAQAEAGLEWGMRLVTHLFNAMVRACVGQFDVILVTCVRVCSCVFVCVLCSCVFVCVCVRLP